MQIYKLEPTLSLNELHVSTQRAKKNYVDVPRALIIHFALIITTSSRVDFNRARTLITDVWYPKFGRSGPC